MYSTKMGSNVKFTVFALLTITLYRGLFFAVWNLHTQSIAQSVNLKDENRNQNNELQSLKSENANLQTKSLNCEALSELIQTPTRVMKPR